MYSIVLSTELINKGISTVRSCTIDVSKLKAWYLECVFTSDTECEQQYVSLVLVREEEIKRTDKGLEEATKLTLQRQIDELLLKKEPLGEVSDIFHYQNKPCPHLILILGGPGEWSWYTANCFNIVEL